MDHLKYNKYNADDAMGLVEDLRATALVVVEEVLLWWLLHQNNVTNAMELVDNSHLIAQRAMGAGGI